MDAFCISADNHHYHYFDTLRTHEPEKKTLMIKTTKK